MSATKVFLQVGAWICALIGLYFGAGTVLLFLERDPHAHSDALILVTYTLLTPAPFVAFVYPRFKPHRKLALFACATIEILLLCIFASIIMRPKAFTIP